MTIEVNLVEYFKNLYEIKTYSRILTFLSFMEHKNWPWDQGILYLPANGFDPQVFARFSRLKVTHESLVFAKFRHLHWWWLQRPLTPFTPTVFLHLDSKGCKCIRTTKHKALVSYMSALLWNIPRYCFVHMFDLHSIIIIQHTNSNENDPWNVLNMPMEFYDFYC